ncbi:mitochondrial amidoxime-reducing component 1-like [Convolutriloba macropyga]|uniref:mitochondrial amidoxime-reducing component 1-like n=1 Tax=Convolutriloba macropyga TaxID=536237 RepID=UPI003F5219F7
MNLNLSKCSIALAVGAAGVGLGIVGLTIYALNKSRKTWFYVGTVKSIALYPIKGVPGFPVGGSPEDGIGKGTSPPVEVTPLGLKCGKLRDRCFVLGRYNKQDEFEFISPRSVPKMMLVKVRPTEDFSAVIVSAPGMEEITVTFPSSLNASVTVDVWRSTGDAFLCCDDNVNKWFSSFLEKDDIHLACGVDLNGKILRPRKPQEEDPKFGKYAPSDMQILFSDAAPLLFVSDVSYDDLNERITSQNRPSLSVQSFKPNIILKSDRQRPFAEDDWSQIRVGDTVEFYRVRPCTRCSVTRVDPETGTFRSDEEPLRTLRTFRLHSAFGRDPLFGSLLAPQQCGTITTGMKIYATSDPFKVVN